MKAYIDLLKFFHLHFYERFFLVSFSVDIDLDKKTIGVLAWSFLIVFLVKGLNMS